MTGAGPDKGPLAGRVRLEARDNGPLAPARTGGKGEGRKTGDGK
jgi:hypothetical protein